ncbi:hypothetical protein [Bosea sp. TAB14]
MVNSGDNQEYEHRTRQARLEGLFYLGCIVFAVAVAFMLRG